VARTQVSQSFVNTGSRQMEVSFVFPLPYDGAIDSLTFMVDGTEYEAKLLPATEARQIYESYIRRNQDPALLEWIGTGMFKTSVFPVPPGAERKVTLRYSQLLRKDHQLTDFLFPLSTAKYTSQPVEKVAFDVAIESSAEIKSVYSPTHSIEVTRSDDHHAVVKYEASNQVPTNDFRLFYDTAAGSLGASVISYRPEPNEDGYFLLLASPEIKAATDERPAKSVIFVVDRSGSMSGKKIEQAREALKFVLNNLRAGDTFNIVAYDSTVESFRPELQKYDDETRKAAIGFVEGLYAGGSTNIDGALSTALNMIQDDTRPNFVIFLTDGLPTAGETNEGRIAAKVLEQNKLRTRIVSFGVGYDVNTRLLDRLSRDNFGQSEFVRPDENIEAHVSRLYGKIGSPVMSDVAVNIDLEDAAAVEEGAAVNRMYPRTARDLFEGEQLVMVGRYKKFGAAKVTISGKVGQDGRKMDFPASFTEHSGDQTYAFVERLWAMRRIGEIIDEIDLSGRNEELVNELVSLSTKHGILTPYTSFLADDQPAVGGPGLALRGGGVAFDRVEERLRQLEVVDGERGFNQRVGKKELREAELPAAAVPADSDDFAGNGDAAATAGFGGAVYRDADTGKAVVADTVRNVGNETLYKRGDLWFAANAGDVDLEKDADKIVTVERFSDDYFKLTAANTASENAVLSRQQEGEELIIKLRDTVYRIK
jgi:Ca-activated chloride channel family protein